MMSTLDRVNITHAIDTLASNYELISGIWILVSGVYQLNKIHVRTLLDNDG